MDRGRIFVCAVMLSSAALGQAKSPVVSRVPMFHAHGMIDNNATNGFLPHVEVVFAGEHANRTVAVDDKGFFQTDLPVGAYKMTAARPLLGPQDIPVLTQYVRYFRVSTPMTVTLNGYLYAMHSCDALGVAETPEERAESSKDRCGGEDSFPAPSVDGVQLRIEISYDRRMRTSRSFAYTSDSAVRRPVLVAYNLFAPQADWVRYELRTQTITAGGHVLIEDQSGQSHADTASFRLKHGGAIRVQ